MLKTQIYLEITENMIIFDVGELQNLSFTRVVATRHEKTLTPIVSKRYYHLYEGGDSNPHETYFNAHWFLRPTCLPIPTLTHIKIKTPLISSQT